MGKGIRLFSQKNYVPLQIIESPLDLNMNGIRSIDLSGIELMEMNIGNLIMMD